MQESIPCIKEEVSDSFTSCKENSVFYYNDKVYEILHPFGMQCTQLGHDIFRIGVNDYLLDNVSINLDKISATANQEVVQYDSLYNKLKLISKSLMIDFDFKLNIMYILGYSGIVLQLCNKKSSNFLINFINSFSDKVFIVIDGVCTSSKSISSSKKTSSGKFTLLVTDFGHQIFAYDFKFDNMPAFNVNIHQMFGNDYVITQFLNENTTIKFYTVDRKFEDMIDMFGTESAIKTLGRVSYYFYLLHKFIQKVIHNDSNAAILGLFIFLVLAKYIPYILFLLYKLLKSLFKKNKFNNDNPNEIETVFYYIVGNWHYAWHIFVIIFVYGVMSYGNIMQVLSIKDNTFLNGGKTILDNDHTFVFAKSVFGYLSCMKLILVLVFMLKQIINVFTKPNRLEEINKIKFMFIISLILIYIIDYRFTTLLILLISNIISTSTEFLLKNWFTKQIK